MVWSSKLNYKRKYENLHGCPLKFGQFFGKFLYFKDERKLNLNDEIDGKEKLMSIARVSEKSENQGFMVDMALIMSKILNFVPEFKRFEIFGASDRFIDSIIENSLIEDQAVRLTNHVTDTKLVLITSKQKPVLSTFLVIFNFHTWIAITISLCVAFVVIFYMNLRLGTVRICPRKELTRPALNLAQIVFGCQQKKLPRGNFGRFLIILIVGLCVMLRMCYWSGMVGFLATREKEQEFLTVEDLISRNYTIYNCKMSALIAKINL
jgi:hypothetical protein